MACQFRRRGVGVVINIPEGETLRYGVQLQFPTTNNEPEHKAILIGHRIMRALEAKK